MRQLSHTPARVRIALARHPVMRRIVILLLAVLAGWSALAWSQRIEAERARWGETAEVWVAAADIAAGDPIGGAAEQRVVPLAVVPPAALRLTVGEVRAGAAPDPPSALSIEGWTARRSIADGAILTDLDIAPGGHLDALLGQGEVAVAVGERIPSGARVGDQVMVVSDGFVLVPAATVVAVHDDRVVLGVAEDLAAGVAAAASGHAGVSVLIRP